MPTSRTRQRRSGNKLGATAGNFFVGHCRIDQVWQYEVPVNAHIGKYKVTFRSYTAQDTKATGVLRRLTGVSKNYGPE
jgi:hypothetical protein